MGATFGPLDDLARRIEDNWHAPKIFTRRVIGATATYYDGPEFNGLRLGEMGDFGLPTRVKRLVHTPDTLTAALGDDMPPWLAAALRPGAPVAWPAWYPVAFQGSMQVGGGYTCREPTDAGLPDGRYLTELPEGLYLTEVARRYDTQDHLAKYQRGLILVSRDAGGVETAIIPDEHWVLPQKVTTGGTLEESAVYDYRTQQPATVTDANGYHTGYTYTPLGMLHTVVRSGPAQDDQLGDTPDQPGIVYAYGLTEYHDSPDKARRPVWVHARTRLLDHWTTCHHADLLPADASGQIAERRDYTDGLDRLLQSRIRRISPSVSNLGLSADPSTPPTTPSVEPPSGSASTKCHRVGGWTIRDLQGRVVGDAPGSGLEVPIDPAIPLVRVDGWVAYDDKGRVVEQYEPFLDDGWAYNTTPPLQRHGTVQKELIHRDPRGISEKITHPDDTERRFVHGRPRSLGEPDSVEPSPWMAYEYDADDNAGRTHPENAGRTPPEEDSSWHAHADTPATVEVDPLGRIITVTERLGDDTALTTTAQRKLRELTTRVQRDIDGNVTQVTDALGRYCYQARYDLLGRAWSETTLDTGTVLTIYDPLGAPIERRDARGACTLDAYDKLHRLSRRWTRARADAPMRLEHVVLYGDDTAAPVTPRGVTCAGDAGAATTPSGSPWRNATTYTTTRRKPSGAGCRSTASSSARTYSRSRSYHGRQMI